ncbi:MAG: hypothetical protein WB786_08830 [Thermoplasmata archaeon]
MTAAGGSLPTGTRTPAVAAGNPGTHSSVDGPLPEAKPESSPVLQKVRDLLGSGDYTLAVRTAYRMAFDGTVRAYGLTVPPSSTDRQFLAEFLRPDMGKLIELLPALYHRYEPLRFGTVTQPTEEDRTAFDALLVKLYSETALGRIDDPLFQPSRPATLVDKHPESAWPFSHRRKPESP